MRIQRCRRMLGLLASISTGDCYRLGFAARCGLGSIIFLVLSVCFLVSRAEGKYSGGTGEPNDPYRIATVEDLNDIGNHPNDWDKDFKLLDDINLAEFSGTQFSIIGYHDRIYELNSIPFAGVFDGNGHTISNFTYISSGVDEIGLFRYVDGPNAEIRNLGLVDPNVNSGTGCDVGSLVGFLRLGVVTGCYVQGGRIWGRATAGGLVGLNEDVIANCYTATCVSGESYVGGLVGTNGWDGTISNCYAISIVSGADQIGGLVGNNHHAVISNCYATSTVTGDLHTGGLVGTHDAGAILNSYAAGAVDGNDFTGGLLGFDARVSPTGVVDCFWDSDVNPDMNGIGNTSDPNVIGRATAEMQTESTFTDAGWDFVEIWNIGENQTYPFLRIYPAGDLNHDGLVNFLDFAIVALHWLEGTE